MEGIFIENKTYINLTVFPIEVISNICDFLNPVDFVPCKWGKKMFDKLPKFTACEWSTMMFDKLPPVASRNFLDSIHPYLLYLMKARDIYNVYNGNNKTFLLLAVSNSKFDNSYIFELIKMGFPTFIHQLEPVIKTLNFDLMKYYHSIGIMKTIPLVGLYHCITQGRLEIIKWVSVVFPKEVKCFTNKLLTSAVIQNNVEIADFFFSQRPEMTTYGWLMSFETQFKTNSITESMCDWLWNHNFRWTKQDAERLSNPIMLKYF